MCNPPTHCTTTSIASLLQRQLLNSKSCWIHMLLLLQAHGNW
jgi:hypothetical protein